MYMSSLHSSSFFSSSLSFCRERYTAFQLLHSLSLLLWGFIHIFFTQFFTCTSSVCLSNSLCFSLSLFLHVSILFSLSPSLLPLNTNYFWEFFLSRSLLCTSYSDFSICYRADWFLDTLHSSLPFFCSIENRLRLHFFFFIKIGNHEVKDIGNIVIVSFSLFCSVFIDIVIADDLIISCVYNTYIEA